MTLESVCICTVTRMLHGCPRHAPGNHATPESTHHMLIRIIENQEKIMAAQDDINAAVTAIQAVTGDLTTAAAAIQAEVNALNAQLQAAGNGQVDTTNLNAAVTALQQAQAAVDALEPPAAPAEPAAPSDGSTPVSGGDAGTGDGGSAS